MKRVLALLFVASLVAPLTGLCVPAAQPRLGINLAGPADWMTELPFVDVFRTSRQWISQRQGAGWGKGPDLAVDDAGWVKKIEPGCYAEAMLCTLPGGHYPAGVYTVLYEGEGKLACGNNAKVKESAPGRLLIDVDAAKGGFSLQLKETDPQNHVRNIRVVMPGFEKTFEKEPFHPVFLKQWKGFACYRFMDWMHTNGSELRTWADRPTPRHATLSKRGVALEWMIDLCNRQKAAAWFCLPHLADDDFVRRFAQMVKERLDPSLKIYIEYSNEVWNGQFKQCQYAGEQKELADQYGLKLIAYEGGQHMAAFMKDPATVKAVSATMHACNRAPRMGELYTRYYDEWAKVGGDLFAVFSSIGAYSNHGAWGLAEYSDSKPADYPKLAATLKWAKAHGQAVGGE